MEKSLMGGCTLRRLEKDDTDGCLALFENAFGTPMPKELWEWKYHGTPGNDGIIAEEGGKIVAHYGGMPRQISVYGAIKNCVQATDAVSDPSIRNLMTKKGVFYRTVSELVKRVTGDESGYYLGFGFPPERVRKYYEKMKLSFKADEIKRVSWSAKKNLWANLMITSIEMQPNALEAVDDVWEQMKASLPESVIPVKDSDFVRYRYFEHPVNRYRVMQLSYRFSHTTLGIIVLRSHDDGSVELSDMICEKSAIPTLIKATAGIAKEMGKERLFGWFTPKILLYLPPYDQIRDEGCVTITSPNFTELADKLRGELWFMSGDTDFR